MTAVNWQLVVTHVLVEMEQKFPMMQINVDSSFDGPDYPAVSMGSGEGTVAMRGHTAASLHRPSLAGAKR